MAKRRKKKYRLVLRRSHPVVWAAVLVLVIACTVALVATRANIENSRSQYEAMRMQAAALEENNNMLSDRIRDLGSVESAIQIAMEKLGLMFPDSIVFNPDN